MQTEVRESQQAPARSAPAPGVDPADAGVPTPRRRRRRYWVDWTVQGPITALGLLATLFFLVMFNVALRDSSAARREHITSAAPEVAAKLQAEDRAFHRSITVLSGVFFVCVAVGMVVLTQRSAGPIRRIGAHLERAARGDLQQRVTLRRRDHFQPLAAHCNRLFEALQRERQADADRLEQWAQAAENATTPTAARALATELRERARAKR